MPQSRSRALLGAALTTSAIIAFPTSASALSIPAPTVAGGDLNLELTGGAAASLKRQHVRVSVAPPGKRSADLLTVPASTVRFGRDKILTTNGGSIVFRKGSRRVSFSTLSTHLSNRIRIRASIDGETKTVLTANRKKTRATFRGDVGELHATKLRLTAAGAREIREGLRLETLGRGTLTKAYGKFTRAGKTPSAPPPRPVPGGPQVTTLGTLSWQQTNVFSTSGGRTWLGYVTSPSIGTMGSFTPSDGAVGDTVTPTSRAGADAVYSTTFPMTGSTVNTAAKTGVVTYAGVVTYFSPPQPAGHGFTVTIRNPRIVFDGSNVARLYATGLRTVGGVGGGASSVVPYDDSQPVFNLDLSAATTHAAPGNTATTFQGAVPSVAVTEVPFPANYPAGSGPDRTPNTFGTFDITVPNPVVPSPVPTN
jgi:hypothetical protein